MLPRRTNPLPKSSPSVWEKSKEIFEEDIFNLCDEDYVREKTVLGFNLNKFKWKGTGVQNVMELQVRAIEYCIIQPPSPPVHPLSLPHILALSLSLTRPLSYLSPPPSCCVIVCVFVFVFVCVFVCLHGVQAEIANTYT